MAGPSQDWLALAGQSLDAGAPPAPMAGMGAPAPTFMEQAGAALGAPPPGPPIDNSALAGGFTTEPPIRQPVAFERDAPMPPAGPEAQPVNYAAAMPQEAPQGGPMPSDVQFRPVVSRGAPAREAATVGPQQAGHLMGQFDPLDQAASDSGQRSLTQAQSDAAMWAGQVQQAEQRQAAAEHAQAKRAQELEVRRAHFDRTVADLGKQQLDTGRYWASQSTGEKIGWGIAVLLGGLGGGGGVGMRALMGNIDEDVNVQREMYKRQLDVVDGQKTAFGMAMDQFQSEDHAMAVARAAALDVTAAKVQQSAAQWKGVEAQNEAQKALAFFQAEREKTLASFLKFQPAQGGGVRYQMAVRGDVLPGTMSEKEAQRAMFEHGVKPGEKRDEATYKAGLDLMTHQAKEQADTEGLGKRGHQKVALEKHEAQQELDAHIENLSEWEARPKDGGPSRLDKAVAGTKLGSAWSTLPAPVPFVETAKDNKTARESFNRFVDSAYDAAIKAAQGSAPTAEQKKSASTFYADTNDTPATMETKVRELRQFLSQTAKMKGARAPAMPGSYREGLE